MEANSDITGNGCRKRRQKSRQFVITFSNTGDPMKMDIKAQAASVPGRIIPLPSEISAGCGLAWKAKLTQREEILDFMKQQDIRWEAIYELDLY